MFSLSIENRLLVEDLLQRFYKDKLFEIITNQLDCEIFDGKVDDLAQMLKVDTNIYRDFNNEPFINQYDGNRVFDSITDKVFKMDAVGISANIQYWYENYIKKLITIKELYGIVGVDRITGEVINFTNPFRIASLIHTNRMLNIPCFYVYKKTDVIKYESSDEMKDTLDTCLSLLITVYRKGLKAKREIFLNKFISLEKYNSVEKKKVLLFTEDSNAEENKISYYSYLYFSDILLYNSFMPHYAVFNLKIKDGRLYNNYFRHLPVFSPNVNIWHNCCTGNLPQVSKEGISCLKISNLGSPFFTGIFSKDTSYYVDLNIKKTKQMLEETFKKIDARTIG